jgi:hypothetical protein
MSESSDGQEMLRKFAQALLSLPPEGARVPVDPAARKLFPPQGSMPVQSEVPFDKQLDEKPSRPVRSGPAKQLKTSVRQKLTELSR